MNSIKLHYLSFFLLTYSTASFGGGVVTPLGPSDVARMGDYTAQDYAEPPMARDPFTISDKMYQMSGAQGANRIGQEFVPFPTGGSLPKMRVRGFVNKGPGKSMALLQIDGEDSVHLIREGDEIGLQHRGNGQPNSVLKVLKISASKVEVQTGGLRQVIIVQ